MAHKLRLLNIYIILVTPNILVTPDSILMFKYQKIRSVLF
jgi:hypothetical protein